MCKMSRINVMEMFLNLKAIMLVKFLNYYFLHIIINSFVINATAIILYHLINISHGKSVQKYQILGDLHYFIKFEYINILR